MKLLSNRLGVKISRYLMFEDSWINVWHFLVRPEKKRRENP